MLDGQWLIRDWLPRRGLSVIWGASGAGKTHFSADMMCHVATGQEWNGCPVEPGLVVNIAFEGQGSLDNRISALASRFGEPRRASPAAAHGVNSSRPTSRRATPSCAMWRP